MTFTVTISIGDLVDAGVRAARLLLPRKTLRATVSRDINLMWRKKEPADEKDPIYREQCPGLTVWSDGGGGEFRGGWWNAKKAWAVIGSGLYELTSTGARQFRGALTTSTGPVSIAEGLTQLVIVDGASGYVLTKSSGAFAQITDVDFYPSSKVGYLDGHFYFLRDDTQQFFWSATIDDAATFDALDFASSESSPDNIVSMIVDHRELWFLGDSSTEVWSSYPTEDGVPVQRNSGAILEVGCIAKHSLCKMDNSIFWLGQDKNGRGIVYTAGGGNGYQPIRISTHKEEEFISRSTDMEGASAWTQQIDGQTFYYLNVPGWDTTLVYDASTQRWHERAELVGGSLQPWRAVGGFHAFGKNLVGDSSGVIYELDDNENTYGGDVMTREVISPHTVSPGVNWVFFDDVRLSVVAGYTTSGVSPVVEMRYSNDGGMTWSGWSARSVGRIGEYGKVPRWTRLGRARDRVWHFRITDDCKAAILGIHVKAQEAAV